MMTVLFMILAAASGARLSNQRNKTEKDPAVILEMISNIPYTTFLFGTLYFLFNSAVITVMPIRISNVLTFCDFRVNIPVAVLVTAFFFSKNGKSAFMKKVFIYVILAIIIIFELAVSDIITLILMIILSHLGTLSKRSDISGKIVITSALLTVIPAISVLISGEWIIAVVSLMVTAIIFLNEKKSIIKLLHIGKGSVNYET